MNVSALNRFNPSEHLGTEEDILCYLEAAMEGNDPKHIARGLGDVARSKGMTEIARKAGLGRQALYAALADNGNLTLETFTSVLGALGFELSVHKKVAWRHGPHSYRTTHRNERMGQAPSSVLEARILEA